MTKTTNYHNTFIAVADDCTANSGEVPPLRAGAKTISGLQYDQIKPNPFLYTSDDVLFAVHVQRNNIKKADFKREREAFFAKGQPCLRTSPLVKRYGWGIYSDAEGKVAMYAIGSAEYKATLNNPAITQTKGMRSKK